MHCVPHTKEAKEKMRKARSGKPNFSRRRTSLIIDGDLKYQCGICKEFKIKEDFPRDKRTILGIKSECRKCHSKVAIKSRDKEKARASKRISESLRRARMVGANGFMPKSYFLELELQWGCVCLKCGSTKNLQWDHIIPLSRGGEHSVSNLQRLCRVCNEIKQARTADYRSKEQIIWVITFKRIKP